MQRQISIFIFQALLHDDSKVEFIPESPSLLSDSQQSKLIMIQSLPTASAQQLEDICVQSISNQKRHEFDLTCIIDEDTFSYHVLIQPETIESARVVFCDFTEQQRGQDTWLKMIGLAAHDIRGPFHPLLGYVSCYLEEFSGWENKSIDDKLALLEDIKKTIPFFHTAINNQLLLSTTLMSWAASYIREDQKLIFDLNEVIIKNIDAAKLKNRNSKIVFLYDQKINVNIFGYQEVIELTLSNLINNCLKYTQEGSITVVVTDDNEKVTISVSDTGVGMSQEEVNKLFSLHPNQKTGIGGEKSNGLGLYLCQHILSQVGYKISVTSILGKGSTFTIIVPKN
ncbi:MAG: hypothetical protein COX77_02845 [Candidatus Komeilibacteria bacterium CG_4_10_14_0_2_um_filter_37_10]|uniref:histidine kinase n=1 Tax=Candidatus Komeilibacteria bacterium CG_4_10_14_0_2_um_filter_37_10 TaxID=1974470 RepID=A0A2M7VEN0_9BACT|nr:MAG: hypothetical protein COX77_02845 [Candidatus Komeilibacteria bacterium CG_4_10_14_0_2_um_filter_37_10]